MSGFTATPNQKTRSHQPGFFMGFFRSWQVLPGLHRDEHFDPIVDFLNGMPEGIMFFTGDGVLEIPHDDLGGGGHPRSLFAGLVAQRNHIIEGCPSNSSMALLRNPVASMPT